eukprot:12004902-Ditylum_brightwellii.AAC.1
MADDKKKSHDLCTHKYARGTPVTKCSGITAFGMPFLFDSWCDGYGKGYTNMTMHMFSGNKIEKQVTVQVLTHQDALIISKPMSPNLSCSDCAFTPIIENPKSVDQVHLSILQQFLRIHPKSAACMVVTSKAKGYNAKSGF